jgi:hypothetical protein
MEMTLVKALHIFHIRRRGLEEKLKVTWDYQPVSRKELCKENPEPTSGSSKLFKKPKSLKAQAKE